MERGAAREKKLSEDNRLLAERISDLEKECASLSLELKSMQNRYHQEVRSRENNEKNRIVGKEEANLEVVKGKFDNAARVTAFRSFISQLMRMNGVYMLPQCFVWSSFLKVCDDYWILDVSVAFFFFVLKRDTYV